MGYLQDDAEGRCREFGVHVRRSGDGPLRSTSLPLLAAAFAQFLVEQVQPDAVVADEFQLGDDQLRVGLFLDLLAAEPFEEIVAGTVLLDRHQVNRSLIMPVIF